MSKLRRWRLDSTRPLALQLAADARLKSTITDYRDDQVWELSLGAGESPALTLQTQYGGRAGLASLVPMWIHEGRAIYQAQTYFHPPFITAFAPGYLRAQGSLVEQLALQAEYWAFESHVIGGRFTLSNAHTQPISVRLDLFGHVGADGVEKPLGLLSYGEGNHALHFGKVGNLQPVVLIEKSGAQSPSGGRTSPKIGREVTIGGRKKVVVRWVHAALPDAQASLALALQWLSRDWSKHHTQVEKAATAIPNIETGDEDLDATIAFAYQQLIQGFLKPTDSLPNASFVATRQPNRGYNPLASTHDRGWNGQAPTLAYLSALAIAPVEPKMAQGIIRNYLAVQSADGSIDWRPGLAGQRTNLLCLPLLARLTWSLFQYTEDDKFLREVFPGLLKFFERWLSPNLDTDGDGFPEWQSEDQTGYGFFPTFGVWQAWAQNADIRRVETPDLLGYLISEANSLRAIAHYFGDSAAETRLTEHLAALQSTLDAAWQGEHFQYRDRDSHLTAGPVVMLDKGSAEEEHYPSEELSPPARLVVHVSGGTDRAPNFTLHLAGIDGEGKAINENANGSEFFWRYGHGAYTSQRVFARIDRIQLEGLIRVYTVRVHTLDTTRLDINALLPLWSVGISSEQSQALVNLLTNPDHFWRPNGVTMVSAQDVNFDPSNANGGGGVWPFWLTLIGEGLIEAGQLDTATELIRGLLAAQTAALKANKSFSEFYHSDETIGLGERGHIGGLVPLHLLLRVLGVRIISARKVWTGGLFAWPNPITFTQYGVIVRRTIDQTEITFPSGQRLEVPNNSDGTWQEIIDPATLVKSTPAPTAPTDDFTLEPETD
ncbi:MAG: hypothetical protein H7175_13360 [Burkholderiales bacterium]|nr:hypothetical protein [Anaerolineae bacterium]